MSMFPLDRLLKLIGFPLSLISSVRLSVINPRNLNMLSLPGYSLATWFLNQSNFLRVFKISSFTCCTSREGGFGLLQANHTSLFRNCSNSSNKDDVYLNSKSQKSITDNNFKKVAFTNMCDFSRSDI